jgi:hypothetical protein
VVLEPTPAPLGTVVGNGGTNLITGIDGGQTVGVISLR